MLPLPDYVQVPLAIQRVHRRMRRLPEPNMEEVITKVVACFEANGIEWCLVGAHATGHYTHPRATANFDFVVADRRMRHLLQELALAVGPLDADDIGGAMRLRAIDVDLIRASSHPLFAAAIEHSRVDQEWRIPPVEVLMAMKFLAMTSPWRRADKKRQDTIDLVVLYEMHSDLDRDWASELAGLVYPGSEREFEALLNRVDRGEKIEV